MQDTFRHQGLRKRLVIELKGEGIKDEKVLKAIEKIPRHFFIETLFEDDAYENKPFPIGRGQTISNPYTVAFQSELLELQSGDKVLEIGTGSGYQAAVLAEIGASVFSIERHQPLSKKAEEILEHLGYHNVQTFYGDGFKGLPTFAPFDKILITAAAPEIPKELLKQMKVNGVMVIPFGEGEVQKMIRIKRLDNNEFEKETFSNFTFVPMLKGVVD
ncbi:MAG TPA: protein-L-isoaspartate(D-aspartate) O-methyltransferase [Chitinophagales bacterium]|jgi:protein-L-isoaspartate(D-aspartate) O-methyltransferase|nr:protein-L-isoaspartate(D-aspartate) O-methyltransferase [Chitinophagales bacterium]